MLTMKKIASLLLAMVLITVGMSYSLAEGKLTVTHKNAIIYTGKDSGVFLARIENTGDEATYCDSGKLVLFSKDDDILVTGNYVNSSPSDILLQPGEYTYAYDFLWNSSLKNAKIGDIKFSMGSDTRGYIYEKVDCSATIDINPGTYKNYVNVTFTNDSDEMLENFYIVAAMFDTDDNLIFINRNSYDTICVHAHSTITMKMYIDSDLIEYYEINGIKPEKADVLVYINKNR